MTPEGFIDFAVCLQGLPPGNAGPWASVAKWYETNLRGLPDEDAPFMMFAIGQKFGTKEDPFRPAPAAIMDLWREIKNPKKMSSIEAVERIQEAVKNGRTGIMMLPKTVYLRGPDDTPIEEIKNTVGAIVRSMAGKADKADRNTVLESGYLDGKKPDFKLGTPVEIKVPMTIKLSGQPDEITNDPTLRKIVKVMGGWESLSTNRSDFLRGQLMKVADAVLNDAGDEVLNELRHGYREMMQLQGERMKELE